MPITDQFYGANTAGIGRTVQDFGLCDVSGEYVYTAKTRGKGVLVVVFFAPDSAPSVRALQAVQQWTESLPGGKWTALAVSEGSRESLSALQQSLPGMTLLLDHELYQTRRWGVSHLPSLYVVSGKTGRVLSKVIGDRAADLDAARLLLSTELDKIAALEAAAAQAAAEKKAAEDAAKAAAPAKA